ncbi:MULTISPECIES: tetratricopeptide repeat protein [Sporosarcina]|uniref:Tetratricopeptide repeat protein n=1 Tax=Sporosarcina contaminans TaxID=633403 RepID=A0ABW3U101_9BACL
MDKKHKNEDRKIISFIPDGEFYYKKGLKSMQRERFDEAHKYLKRAVELSPNDPRILMQFGILVMEEGEFEEAYEYLTAAHGLDPEEEDIIFYLAEVHAHLGLLRDAKIYAEKYIALAPDGPLADDSMEIIDFAEQEESFSLDEDMPDSEVYFLQEKARKLMESGSFPEAIRILESIIVDYPDFWAAYNNLALAYFYIGEIEHAKELLYDVLEKNKGNLHALCNLAVFYYYEKDKEKLNSMLELLLKIKPYQFEHRFKLGATFALVGKHEEGFNWLRSLKKKGFEGDAGYYFWLSHSAYFSGHEDIAKEAYEMLTQLDPEKAGFEPWKNVAPSAARSDAYEQDRDFLISKILNQYRSERLLGYYLLGKSAHKQELISHPEYIDVDKLTVIEQLFLAHSLDYEFTLSDQFDHLFDRAIQTTDLLYEKHQPLTKQGTHLFQMWFTLCEVALLRSYHFRNPAALAAAADYMFRSSRYTDTTKTSIAKEYGISVPTLTKYVEQLMEFLPHFKS